MGPSLTLSPEILSPPHHLSLDGATTSTPSYLMLAALRSRGVIFDTIVETEGYQVSALGTPDDGLTS